MHNRMSERAHRELRRATCSAFILLLISGCGNGLVDPPEGFSAAWWSNACGPVDQAAVTLYLGATVPEDVWSPPYPHLQVWIYSPPNELPGRKFQWDSNPSTDVGHASLCITEGDCETATSVVVEFGQSDGTSVYSGRLSVGFADRAPIAGSFSAAQLEYDPLCG